MKLAKRIVLVMISIIVVIMTYYFVNLYSKDNAKSYIQFTVRSDAPIEYQVFYADNVNEWVENNSIHLYYSTPNEWEKLKVLIPKQSEFIRIDTGTEMNQIEIKDITVISNSNVKLDLSKSIPILNQLELKNGSFSSGLFSLQTTGNDPFFYFRSSSAFQEAQKTSEFRLNGLAAILAVIVASCFYFIVRYIKQSFNLLIDFYENRGLIFSLAKNDFKTKYASSYLGILWGFINPLLTIVTYWFVFQVGLRNGDIGEVPFIIWFIAGIIPWFFFSDALSSATNVFTEYSYLVKKVVFKIELLPIVKIMSALFVQLFFIVFIFIVYAFYGMFPTLFSFQLIYYLICLVVLAVSLSFFTSAIFLFFRDLNQIIAVILQIGFWFTPIGWSVSMLSEFWTMIFKLNPMFYVVQGYRDTLVNHILFIDRPYQTVYFWIFCLVMFTVGFKVFKKLKPHFSDVL